MVALAGSGARNDDMDNTCELLINVVSASKPMMLTNHLYNTGGGLNQKVMGMVKAFEFRFAQSMIPPADRQILSHRVKSVEHGKPDCLHASGNRPAGDRQAGMGCWKKRMAGCNCRHTGFNVTRPERGAHVRRVLNGKSV